MNHLPRHPWLLLLLGPVTGLIMGTAVVTAAHVAIAGPPPGVAASPGETAGGPGAGAYDAAGAPATVPAFTYAAPWTLLEAARHADAGDVVAISALDTPIAAAPSGEGTPGSSVSKQAQPIPVAGASLVARTTGGQLVPIVSGTSAGEAIAVLRSLGYGHLLTEEALAASTPAESGPFGLLLFAGFAAGVLGVLAILGRRARTPRGPAAAGRGGRRPVGEQAGTMPTDRLSDVAGVDEAKLELTETIEFLKEPERFARLGAKPVRGVLLYGPPGTGKTLLARAVAHEAGVPFFAASGSEFVEKYVGVGAARIRDLFASARRAGRGVIFIDELDAIAKARGGPNSHDEREQALNQLLVELDGFATADSVVVLAATNRLDTLDQAILRPGRFTRKIHVGSPDRDAREAILSVHAKGKPLAPSIDLAALARKTFGFSGAMLADLLNESAIMAVREGRDAIEPADVHRGWLKVAVGSSRQRSMDERERSIIAAHEAGHAICGRVHGDRRRVEEISLYQHGDALGVTVSSAEDDYLPAESDLRARLVALMGGRVAEELLFHEYTGGASNDFEKATELAANMVLRWGMGTDPADDDPGVTGRGVLSTLVVGRSSPPVASDTRDAQGRAIRGILDDAYAAARRTLLAEMDRLNRVSAYLFEHERIDGEEFDALFEGRLAPLDDQAWRTAAAHPRTPEEIAAAFETTEPPRADADDRPAHSLRSAGRGRRGGRPVGSRPAALAGGARRRVTLRDRLLRRPLVAALRAIVRASEEAVAD